MQAPEPPPATRPAQPLLNRQAGSKQAEQGRRHSTQAGAEHTLVQPARTYDLIQHEIGALPRQVAAPALLRPLRRRELAQPHQKLLPGEQLQGWGRC